jgi:hypothetical protein
VAKRSDRKNGDRKDGKKARKASAKRDRELLEIGEDLLTAVHLHQAVQDSEVRAALASTHADLVQAAGDLVSRIAGRFLETSGTDTSARDRSVSWSRDEVGGSLDVTGAVPAQEAPSSAAH